MKEAVLKIQFPDKAKLEKFMDFMDLFGEQIYWEWIGEYPESLRVNKFTYNYKGQEILTQ